MKIDISSQNLVKPAAMNRFGMKAVLAGLVMVFSMTACSDSGNRAREDKNEQSENTAARAEGVVLRISDAALIQVDAKPQYNTAEWNFMVQKPGRYDVWLSSLTVDTVQPMFEDNVVITAGDSRLDKKPVGDEIVISDITVKAPWYRADSHMGSIFFSKPGEYQVQVISDKVERYASDLSDLSVDKGTLISSLILKPMVN